MRIASLSPAVTEILFALGAAKSIVCTDKFSDYPEEAMDIPHLPEHQALTADLLAPHKPEIIFTATLVQDRLQRELQSDQWKVIHFDPRTLNDVASMVTTIGLLTDKEKEAKALNESMRLEFRSIEKKAALLLKKLPIYIEEWHNPPMVSGNWVPEIARLAGGIPLKLEDRAPSREVSLAEITTLDPEIIVLSICGAGRFSDPSLLTKRVGWSDLRAVVNHQVKIIDDSLLNRPGPRLVDGAKRLYGWIVERAHAM